MRKWTEEERAAHGEAMRRAWANKTKRQRNQWRAKLRKNLAVANVERKRIAAAKKRGEE
jgi:hypothetical protein